MNSRWIKVLIVSGSLVVGAVSQEYPTVRPTGSDHVSAEGLSSAQLSPGANQQSDAVTLESAKTGQGADGAAPFLSREFTVEALKAAFQMQSTERRVEQSIKRGFPLGEFWIPNDLDLVDDSLKLAALSVKNDADQEALNVLENESTHLRLWADWLLQANRNLQLANYYISPDTLDNDETFQSAVACTQSLVSMLTTRRLAEDRSCY